VHLDETLLARVALGIVALHIVDDSFVQPEPGASAGDHLVSGLVPTAILVAVAWGYPRLRAGARAAVALGFGVFGAVTGVEAAYSVYEGTLSAADVTGLLALAAGLLLVGLGVVTLWRSRKAGSRKRRYLRRTLVGVVALLAAYFVVYPVSLAYVVTNVARAVIPEPELGAAHEDVTFTTSDGLELAGWYVPSRNGAAVIAFPGRKGPQPHARMLIRHGYGVLLFDRRGEGASEGDPNTLGWEGDLDLAAALAYLRSRPDVDPGRIGGLGLSVGGEMLIDTAAGSDELRAVVSEGAGIRSVRETVDIPATGPRIQLSILFAVVTAAVAVFSDSLPPPSLTELVGEISPRPLFLIEAERGQGGETELTDTYYEAAGAPKERWVAPGSHTGGIEAAPEEYERRVVTFFDRALLGSR
jgi:dienelactone hydrolase